MSIFIGSAYEKTSKAEELAQALEGAGFEVVRWWNDPRAFPGGEQTLHALIEWSNRCDGAAFVFGADDNCTATIDGKTVTQNAPRDNVILEYGLFVGKLGSQRTQFLVEDGVKVPTDLKGITWCSAHNEIPKLVDSLKDALGSIPRSDLSSRVQIHASRRLTMEFGIPAGWNARAMYLDHAGAVAWGALENDPKYWASKSAQRAGQAINRLARQHQLSNFGAAISFGPGIGIIDSKVLSGYIGNELLEYIPIDINLELALKAADKVNNAQPRCQVPFCIRADFEEEMRTITEVIRKYARQKRLFVMLGGTFGNLEKGEDGFLKGLKQCMTACDIAILDISISRLDYDVSKDPYRWLQQQRPTIKGFLASGVARRLDLTQAIVEESVDEHVEFEVSHTSNIEGTPEFVFQSKEGKHPLIYVRRYRFDDLKRHLEEHGFCVFAAESVGDPNENKHRGIFFLKKT